MPKTKNTMNFMQQEYKRAGSFVNNIVNPGDGYLQPISNKDVVLDFRTLTVDKIKDYTHKINQGRTHVYDEIAKSKGPFSFAKVIWPLIRFELEHTHMRTLATQLQSFHTDKALRDASSDAEKSIKEHAIECEARQDVYAIVKAYFDTAYKKEKQQLTHEEQRYVEQQMRDYKRTGLHLPIEQCKRVKEINQRLTKIETDFNRNLDEENTSFELSKQELEGMPQSWFSEDKKLPNGKYKVTLNYPDYLPAIKNLTNRKVREKLFKAFDSRCKEENSPLLVEAVKLRHEKAQLLGYASFADFSTEVKMAKTGDTVLAFENEMKERFKPVFDKDMQTFLALAIKETGDPNFKLQMWDLPYYNRMATEEACNVKMEDVKAYFPIQKVTKGLFDIYEKLLGVKFIECETTNKWHESVKLYVVYNFDHQHNQLGEEIGRFYLDMHPREGKYGHAAAFDFVTGADTRKINAQKGRTQHVATMACNFPENGCISFDDVVTYFHEFGHIMHLICSKPQIQCYSGFGAEWDFVEAPSQMLENWCYSSAALKLMSEHKDTKQPIPDELIEKLKQEKTALAGYANMRQLSFGLVDMALHSPKVAGKRVISTQHEWAKVYKDVIGLDVPPGTDFLASFGHIMGCYEAGYYGYMMSKTYSSDMFDTVFKDHELDPERGKRYRKCILEPGASKDAMDLLIDFLGRRPTIDAFLKEHGLKDAPQQEAKKHVTFSV